MTAIEILEQQQNDETLNLEIAYTNLYNAYISGNRNEMVARYVDACSVNIPSFRNSIRKNTQQVMLFNGVVPDIQPVSIYDIKDDNLLWMNVKGCINALQRELDNRNIYRTKYTYAQNVLYKHTQPFHQDDVLYRNKQGQQLKVADFLEVSKYAIGIAEAIEPNNKGYAEASAAITVLQGIDTILNNKPEDKPINKMLHLANSFISSVVKSSVKNDENKRGVTVTALMVDLVIDFFCKK